MTEPTDDQQPTGTQPTNPDTGTKDAAYWEAEATKYQSLMRKQEERAKANAEKAKRLDELEEQSKTEVQKLQDALAAAEKRATEAEQKVADRDAKDALTKERDEVAKAKGLSSSLLRGSSREEYEQHADELIAAGIKPVTAPSADGQGDAGNPVGAGEEKSADEILAEV